MIFELSRRFSTFTANEWIPYVQAIENLITVHGQGWHIFSPSREVGASILAGCELSQTQKLVFRHYILEKVAVISGQAKNSSFTVLCVPDGFAPEAERRNQLVIPLREFLSLDNCQPSQLFVENAQTDGAFWEMLADLASRELGYGMPINLAKVNGGGATTGACYRGACQAARPAICVVDSDRKYPGGALGETAQSVISCAETHPTVQSYALPVREVENAIPLSFLYEVYQGNGEVCARIGNLVAYVADAKARGLDPSASVPTFPK